MIDYSLICKGFVQNILCITCQNIFVDALILRDKGQKQLLLLQKDFLGGLRNNLLYFCKIKLKAGLQ